MSLAQRFTAIAFDLDGTLVDSVPDLAAATNETLKEFGLPQCSEALVRTWVGNGARVLMARALTHALGTDVEESQLDKAMPRFLHHYERYLEQFSCLYDGVLETLNELSAMGYRLAVVTNKPHHLTLPLLKAFGIDTHFEMVLGGDSLARMKPDPLPLQHILESWSLKPSELLMVGDSRNDIIAAKAAGISAFGLTYGYNYGEDIGLCGPDAVCNTFAEILTRLNGAA